MSIREEKLKRNRADFSYFDALPPNIREVARNMSFPVNARDVWVALNRYGVPQWRVVQMMHEYDRERIALHPPFHKGK